MKLSLPLCLVFLSLLCGCSSVLKQRVTLSNQYDAKATQVLLENGNATIKGSALLRQNGGGVVTCAGNEVSLIPVTPYSTERITYIYGNTENSFVHVMKQNIGGFTNTDNDFLETGMKKTMCDAQGFFKFENIKDGNYYVATAITWTVGYLPEGGSLMKKVSVTKGETKEIVLTKP